MRLLDDVSFRALARQIAAWLALEYPQPLGACPARQMQAIGAHLVAAGRWLGLTMKQDFAFLAQMMMTSGGWSLQGGTLPAIRKLIDDTPAPKAEGLAKTDAGLHAQTPQGALLSQWSDLHAHPAALPFNAALTPAQFDKIQREFLPETGSQVAAATASIRARLLALGLTDDLTEGEAVLLALLFRPRFFEDPLKPWSDLDRPAPSRPRGRH